MDKKKELVEQIQQATRPGREDEAREHKESLWKLLQPRVSALAGRFRQRAQSAGQTIDDLVQEAWIKFDDVIVKFDVNRDVELWTWLGSVLRNHIIDFLRKKEREQMGFIPLPATGPQPVVDDKAKLLSGAVQSTVDTLLPDDPKRDRKILAFKLHYKEDYTFQKVADTLHVSIGATHDWVKKVEDAFRASWM